MYQRFLLFVLTGALVSALLLFSFYLSEADFRRATQHLSWSSSSSTHEVASSLHEVTKGGISTHPNTPGILVGPPLAATRPDGPATTTLGLPTHQSHQDVLAPKQVEAVMVLSTVAASDNSWLHDELSDLLEGDGGYTAEVYVNDDPHAPLHPPANKGHEAMTYLTYIIDHYDELPPVAIFLHGHRGAWHNNPLLDMSTAQMVQHLRLDKVEQDGYFNLRCHFNPGCPEHLYPFATEHDGAKSEEADVRAAWMQVFQVDEEEVPRVLAQACCSQFAVTADRIRQLPLEKYIHFRDWLLATPLSDYVSGRLFEYFWQYMLHGTPVFCPDPRICYCEGYGVCFEQPGDYDRWMELKQELDKYEDQLHAWHRWVGNKAMEKRREEEEERSDRTPNRGAWLVQEIDTLRAELERRKQAAMEVGADSARRVAAVERLRGLEPPVTEPRDMWREGEEAVA